ncbi:MAG: endolytic transglycosylase MltG, partial [Rubrobacter sp.]|nr:endolytic transglycosylase MltG [Rubrobacter sp.]
MKRYDKSKRRHREEVDARLSALQRSRPRPRRKRRSNVGPAVLGLLLVAGVLGAVYFIYAVATGGQDEQAPDGAVKVEVVKGDTLESVSRKLEEAGVIDSAFMFEAEARMEGYSTEIKPGEYTFTPGADSDQILEKLTAGAVVPTIAITIPEGLTLQETAQEVAEQSGVSAAECEAAARRTDYGFAYLEDPAIKSTEGFLFPAKYEFERGVTASQIVSRLLEQYLLETQTLDIAGAMERLNLTEYELVTVASLIEREAASAKERPLVASVIY